VVHVVCSDRFAGTERHVATLAHAQREAGHQVHLVGGDAALAALAGNVEHLPAATVLDALAALRRLPAADVLHAHMTDAEVVLALHPGHRAAARVATRHFARRRGSDPFRRVATTMTARRLDGQIAVSRYVADRVEGNSTVIHPGVPELPVRDATRSPVVLVVQRLEAEKATDVALTAFARSGLAPGWRMQVAGSGAEADSLRRLALDLGIAGHVDFLGARDDVPELMAAASVLVAPCPVEGLGLAVVEAMAAGLPVVATAAGGHLESAGSVDESWLFAPGDAEAAADRLRRAAADAAGLLAYGDALRERQRTHFSVDRWRAQTDDFYRSLS
jgi:glycosyltransferase involved in cell wall biosynthesis